MHSKPAPHEANVVLQESFPSQISISSMIIKVCSYHINVW